MKKNADSIPAAAPTAESILKLTKEQEYAALLRRMKDTEEIAAAIGVSPDIIEGWEEQSRFLVEIAQFELDIKPDTEVKQAAALAFHDFSYADAETAIGLEEGTIMSWAQDADSAFNLLLNRMRYRADPPQSDFIHDAWDQLSDEQNLAIPLILQGKTDAEVGAAIGKTRETVNRWRNCDENFEEALADARHSHFESQKAAVSAGAEKAISALEELLNSEDEKIRLQAASVLLKLTPSLKK